MKKIYYTPATRLTKVDAENVIAGSILTTNGTTATVDITDNEYNDVFAVKQYGGYNVWDDAW